MFPDPFRDDVFTLETRRLFLRWPRMKDAPQLVGLAGERAIADMTATIPHPFTLKAAEERVLRGRALNHSGEGLSLVLSLRARPHELVGLIGVSPHGEEAALDLGYLLGRAYWGQGFATEAAQGMLDAAFLYSHAGAVTASIRVGNAPSRKVLERCGFQYEGSGMRARPAWGDSNPVDWYRLTRGLWSSLKGWRSPASVPHPTHGDAAKAG